MAPGSFGAQNYEAADRGEATLHEATLLMRTFMTAGLDTTVNGFSNAVMCFSRAPEQWQILRSDPGLARSAGRSVMDAAVDNNVPGIAGECDGHFVQEDKGEEVAQALVEFIRAN